MSELIDNRAQRIKTLKEIITRLHAGEDPENVKALLAGIVRETDSTEIAAMEQELMAEGMSVAEVQSMCDLHSAVLRDFIKPVGPMLIPAGHPVDTMMRENEALLTLCSGIRGTLETVAALDDSDSAAGPLESLRGQYNELMDVEKHYRRKENLLFAVLERHGVSGPSKVMWGKDDEVRALLKELGAALAGGGDNAAEWKVAAPALTGPTLAAVEEMVFKERQILLPMALQTLTADEWAEIWRQSPEYGWCLVEPGADYAPAEAVVPGKPAQIASGEALHFPTGSLSLEQLLGIFRSLPVDITFVDDQDRVAFFSEGDKRVFSRSKAIIGRKVHHCHPPKSVHIVDRILSDFRSGEQSVAEFWIQKDGLFVNIRYFAVRDGAGKYLGTLEVTQELSHQRGLSGERRLLEYDTPETGENK